MVGPPIHVCSKQWAVLKMLKIENACMYICICIISNCFSGLPPLCMECWGHANQIKTKNSQPKKIIKSVVLLRLIPFYFCIIAGLLITTVFITFFITISNQDSFITNIFHHRQTVNNDHLSPSFIIIITSIITHIITI